MCVLVVVHTVQCVCACTYHHRPFTLEMNAKTNDQKGTKFYVFEMNQPSAVRTTEKEAGKKERNNNIAHALLHPRI